MRYAIATGRAERDIAQDLLDALPPVKGTHLAAITEPKKVAKLSRLDLSETEVTEFAGQLNDILEYVEKLNKLDTEGKRVLNVIQSNINKMGQLIEDLLSFSRKGRQELEKSRVNMEGGKT